MTRVTTNNNLLFYSDGFQARRVCWSSGPSAERKEYVAEHNNRVHVG